MKKSLALITVLFLSVTLKAQTGTIPVADGAVSANYKVYIVGASFANFLNSELKKGFLLITDLDGTQISRKIIGEPTSLNTSRTNPIALNNRDIVVVS